MKMPPQKSGGISFSVPGTGPRANTALGFGVGPSRPFFGWDETLGPEDRNGTASQLETHSRSVDYRTKMPPKEKGWLFDSVPGTPSIPEGMPSAKPRRGLVPPRGAGLDREYC